MKIPFCKYSATGNTFVMIDNRGKSLNVGEKDFWAKLANKEAVDGIIFVETSKKADFQMRYLNADGGEVEMCGNGGRAIGVFAAYELGLEQSEFKVETMNGEYLVNVSDLPKIKMTEMSEVGELDVSDLLICEKSFYVKTGVPHAIYFVRDVLGVEIERTAPPIRNNTRFTNGTNVNFVQILKENYVALRTFERGVEAETQSCGTGATAVAIALNKLFDWSGDIVMKTPGGDLTLSINEDCSEIYLCGMVEKYGSGFFEK